MKAPGFKQVDEGFVEIVVYGLESEKFGNLTDVLLASIPGGLKKELVLLFEGLYHLC